MSGKLIVIEGLDGSGKATQMERLCKYFNEKNIEYCRLSFPNYKSPSSSLVKMYLGGEFADTPEGVNAYAASAFYAVDRCAGFLQNRKKYYDSGAIIVADRYTTSNEIYQMGKLPESEWNGFLEWIEDFEYKKLGVPKPDKVIYLDMAIDISQKLLAERYNGDESKKDIHESNVEFLLKCRKSAFYAARKLGWIIVPCDNGKNPRSIDVISTDIKRIIDEIL